MMHARTPLALATVFLLLLGCASQSRPRVGDDPLLTARRADIATDERVAAVREAAARVASGEADRLVTRYAMKELAWALDTPELVRAAALEAILWDEPEAEDSRKLVREMLPTEPSRACVSVLATAAAEQGWTDATPALVRSLAAPLETVAVTERAEYQALRELHPTREPAEVALAVFLDPQTAPGPAGLRLDMRVREAAWDLLGRLEPDPAARARLLDTPPGADEEGTAILNDLRRVRDAFGVVPERGEEVRWALRLTGERDGRLAAWWRQTSAAVAQLPAHARADLALRHLEAVRWASLHETGWLTAPREALLDELAAELAGRQVYSRTKSIEGIANANAERLSNARDQLRWGDALVILVVDRALREPAVREALFQVAEADNRDSSTEHGGTLWADADGFHAQHFPPRGSPNPDDRRFVAPREMIDYSSAALAHFHFHVASWRNRDFAGPSPADFDYADRFGRACVVFSGISRGVLNADVYFPGGVVVDLGEVRAPDA